MPTIQETYLENEAALKRYLRRFTVHAVDAEDLAQEAFLKAFAAESLQPITSPKAFLYRIARNLALNERAKRANATTVPLEDLADPSVIENASQVTLEDEMEGRQRIRLLAQAMAGLPPQCSRVFLLRKVYGLSYKEIAEKLGISVSTAEKHAALGLLRCSEYLRRQGGEIEGAAGRSPSTGEKAAGRVARFELKRLNRARNA